MFCQPQAKAVSPSCPWQQETPIPWWHEPPPANRPRWQCHCIARLVPRAGVPFDCLTLCQGPCRRQQICLSVCVAEDRSAEWSGPVPVWPSGCKRQDNKQREQPPWPTMGNSCPGLGQNFDSLALCQSPSRRQRSCACVAEDRSAPWSGPVPV